MVLRVSGGKEEAHQGDLKMSVDSNNHRPQYEVVAEELAGFANMALAYEHLVEQHMGDWPTIMIGTPEHDAIRKLIDKYEEPLTEFGLLDAVEAELEKHLVEFDIVEYRRTHPIDTEKRKAA
jgi:hypothetical protein